MKLFPKATIISLTAEERRALEALAGSRKGEARLRDRARIVLLAASGLGSRAVAGEIGCTPGTRRSGGSAMPVAGYSNWTAPLLARDLADIHEPYIWRVLRGQKIDQSGRKSGCQSNDPDFVPKTVEIFGLYMNPPDMNPPRCMGHRSWGGSVRCSSRP